ncbi:intersectin-EH binding protein Ibp1 [Mycobacterium hodleri]|uniref:intersectin-EH binding protein Ibp1 n=1 Tax=Mycolicibacterium hodleri TaxID=49897 RepID=UPI0021F3BA97|nr:intersectin-EH binding protein Ibp1 [Mycolicibacterium hodleri]MCV7134914.1 intersectin-EH binding protein Ibp1 [Mycolicibacterium hodleri]
MSHSEFSVRRLILAGGFALAVAASPAVAAFAVPTGGPGTQLADDCAAGEDADPFTGSCVPFAVPNSPLPPAFTTPAGNPDIPEIDGVPCTGRDSGACIGLSEDAPQYVPPTSSVGSDPTITGSTN